jgi:hypothetical protein
MCNTQLKAEKRLKGLLAQIDNGKFGKGYLTRKRTWRHQTEKEDKKSNISQQTYNRLCTCSKN